MENAINNFIYLYLSPNNIMLLFVILLVVIAIAIILIIYTELKKEREINNSFSIEQAKKEIEEDSLIKKLDSNDHLEKIEEYESEQEKKAIISYEELLNNASKLQIDYEDEEDIPDLVIHKVNVSEKENNILNRIEKEEKLTSFYSYEAEEDFLRKLKEFRANL